MAGEIALAWENWAAGARSVCPAHPADLRLHNRQCMPRPDAIAITAESLPGRAPSSRLDTGIMQAHRANIGLRDAAVKSVGLSDDSRLAERPSRAVQDWKRVTNHVRPPIAQRLIRPCRRSGAHRPPWTWPLILVVGSATAWLRELRFPHPRLGPPPRRGRDHGREISRLNTPIRLGYAAASRPDGAELLPGDAPSRVPLFRVPW